ncbi:hypothetical protein [Trueperella bialowiezensis]|nr:hypothetical protein [Trueperella bialowiezensis]
MAKRSVSRPEFSRVIKQHAHKRYGTRPSQIALIGLSYALVGFFLFRMLDVGLGAVRHARLNGLASLQDWAPEPWSNVIRNLGVVGIDLGDFLATLGIVVSVLALAQGFHSASRNQTDEDSRSVFIYALTRFDVRDTEKLTLPASRSKPSVARRFSRHDKENGYQKLTDATRRLSDGLFLRPSTARFASAGPDRVQHSLNEFAKIMASLLFGFGLLTILVEVHVAVTQWDDRRPARFALIIATLVACAYLPTILSKLGAITGEVYQFSTAAREHISIVEKTLSGKRASGNNHYWAQQIKRFFNSPITWEKRIDSFIFRICQPNNGGWAIAVVLAGVATVAAGIIAWPMETQALANRLLVIVFMPMAWGWLCVEQVVPSFVNVAADAILRNEPPRRLSKPTRIGAILLIVFSVGLLGAYGLAVLGEHGWASAITETVACGLWLIVAVLWMASRTHRAIASLLAERLDEAGDSVKAILASQESRS